MSDDWEFRIHRCPARHIGYRWWVKTYLNGRADPGVPERRYAWALTRRGAMRRATEEAADRAVRTA